MLRRASHALGHPMTGLALGIGIGLGMVSAWYWKPRVQKATNAVQKATNAAPLLIRLDGSISSGKSTLLKRIIEHMPSAVKVAEPLDHWQSITDDEGKNILQRFYEEPARWACLFQVFAFVTRLECLWKVQQTCKQASVLVSERSIHSDMNIFARNAYESRLMTTLEWKLYQDIYDRWLQLFAFKTKPDLTIYIRSDPEVCLQRIALRNRAEEKDKISIEYLQALHQRHEDWIKTVDNVIVVNGNVDNRDDPEFISDLIAEIQPNLDRIRRGPLQANQSKPPRVAPRPGSY